MRPKVKREQFHDFFSSILTFRLLMHKQWLLETNKDNSSKIICKGKEPQRDLVMRKI